MHVTAEQLRRLRDRTLPPAATAEVGRHAAACDACGRAVREAMSLDGMTRNVQVQFEAEHLSDDELMACADGTGREPAHLRECDVCRNEVDELRAFRGSMRPRRRWLPFAIAASLALFAIALAFVLRQRTHPAPPVVATSTPPVPSPPALPPRPAEWEAWVADARAKRALPMPADVAELWPHETELRGAAEADELRLSPDHVVVATTRPEFRWAARKGARYVVILREGRDVVQSRALTEPRWTPPHELHRGSEVLWQVEVTSGGARSLYPKAPAPPARFRVLSQSAVDEIAQVRRRDPDDALLEAVVLARHGLRAETLAALDRLQRSDPALATDLRASLRDWPG